MDVVLGIAAKSLDAAYQLAKALHGPRVWAWQQSVSLQPAQSSHIPAPEAKGLLLLSHDRRTGYLLLATHATPEQLLIAVANASRRQQQQPQQQHPQPEHPRASVVEDPERRGGGANSNGDGGDGSGALALVPPLQRLQQCHAAAVNVLLLQLFLSCDAVLVLLPTGQGLGAGSGSGGGGPLSGATEWMSRLRLLQAAKRALHQNLLPGGGSGDGGGGTHAGLGPLPQPPPSAVAAGDAGSGTDGGILPPRSIWKSMDDAAGLAQLRTWCCRSRPPALFFVSPTESDPPAPAAASSSSAEPRDANWLLRNLLKRCRPVQLSGSAADQLPPPSQLCVLDPAVLVLEPGPLALEPAAVHTVVLSALLDSDSADGGFGAGVGGASIPGRYGDQLRRLKEVLEAAFNAAGADEAAAAERGGGAEAGSVAPALAAVQRFTAGWRAAASALYDVTIAAWRAAAAQPLDWVPQSMEAAHGLRQAPAPGHAASTAHGRSRPRAAATAALPGSGTTISTAASSSGPRTAAFLEPAAVWLAAGADGLAARLASELCQEAAAAALRQYDMAVPPRYPERVHAAAVAAAVAALLAAAPPGPASTAAAAALRAGCEATWRRPGAARRQCSALSATGRPCSRLLHDALEPHCSETTTIWVSATATGSALVALPDAFDLQALNASPDLDDGARVAAPITNPQQQQAAAVAAGGASPAAGGRGKGGKRGPGGGGAAESGGGDSAAASGVASPAAPVPAHSRHLVVAVAQAADGSTRHCVLGPWVTVTRLGPASSYSERRGLANQPGLNGSHLFPLTLQLEAEPSAAARQQRAAGGAGRPRGGAGRPTVPRVTSVGSSLPDASSPAGAGSSDSEGGVVLDEHSFPSLAEAAAAMQAGRQQQPAGAAGPVGPMGRRGGGRQPSGGKAAAAGAADVAAAAGKERERLAKVWPHPYGNGWGSGRAGSTSAAAARRARGDVGAGGPAVRGAGRRGRGSGQGTAVAAAGAGSEHGAAFAPLAGSKDVKKLHLSYEYETLDGRRFLATQQQLAASVAAAASTAAAAAVSGRYHPARASTPPGTAASSVVLAPPQNPNPNQSKKPQAPKPGSGPAGAGPNRDGAEAAAAAAAALGTSSVAASFLLQHDVPLYLAPPPGLQPDAAAPTAHDGAASWDPTPRRPAGLAQLRRIFVVTPPSASGEPLLASRPTVQFRVLQPPQLPWDAAVAAGLLQPLPVGSGMEGGQGGRGGDAGCGDRKDAERTFEHDSRRDAAHEAAGGITSDGGSDSGAAKLVSGPNPTVTVVQVSLARPVPLPPDSLVVVSLPYLYGLPAAWLGWGGGCDARHDTRAGGVTGASAVPGEDVEQGRSVELQGGKAVAGADGSREASAGEPGPLLPLVQLDERTPYEVRLLAGSALFPMPASAQV